jgi:hypothetical protein
MPDESQHYVSDEGEALSFFQIAMASSKEPNTEVEEVDEGFRVDGTLYRPVEPDDASESVEADESEAAP